MPDIPLPTTSRAAGAALAAAAMLVFAFAPQGAQARGVGESFAPLVKEVSPAVVNIAASRQVAGRDGPGGRLALVEGVELLPGRRSEWELTGVRRDRDHLFLRYAVR